MSYFGRGDFYLDVARGLVGNAGFVQKFGRNDDVDSASAGKELICQQQRQ